MGEARKTLTGFAWSFTRSLWETDQAKGVLKIDPETDQARVG